MAKAEAKRRASGFNAARPSAVPAESGGRSQRRTNGCRSARKPPAIARQHSDIRQVPLAVAAPVGEVATAPAKRAFGADGHSASRDPGSDQPLADHSSQIEHRRRVGTTRARFSKCRKDFGANLVATSADRRTKVRKQRLRVAAKRPRHGRDPSPDDPVGRPSPAGVKKPDSPVLRVRQKHGNAIGQRNRQQHAGSARGVSVAVTGDHKAARNRAVNVHDRPVHLTASHHRPPSPPVVQLLDGLGRDLRVGPVAGDRRRHRRVAGGLICKAGGSVRGRTRGRGRGRKKSPSTPRGTRSKPRERGVPSGCRTTAFQTTRCPSRQAAQLSPRAHPARLSRCKPSSRWGQTSRRQWRKHLRWRPSEARPPRPDAIPCRRSPRLPRVSVLRAAPGARHCAQSGKAGHDEHARGYLS